MEGFIWPFLAFLLLASLVLFRNKRIRAARTRPGARAGMLSRTPATTSWYEQIRARLGTQNEDLLIGAAIVVLTIIFVNVTLLYVTPKVYAWLWESKLWIPLHLLIIGLCLLALTGGKVAKYAGKVAVAVFAFCALVVVLGGFNKSWSAGKIFTFIYPSTERETSSGVSNRKWTMFVNTPDMDSLRTIIDLSSNDSMLVRFAACESNGRQYADPARTRVLVGPQNNDGTYDRGILQINDVHKSLVDSLGIDISTLNGQVAIGRVLYARSGSDPWMSSRSCWSDLAKTKVTTKASVVRAKEIGKDTLVAPASGEFTEAVYTGRRDIRWSMGWVDNHGKDYVVRAWIGESSQDFPYPYPLESPKKVLTFYPDSIQVRRAMSRDSLMFMKQLGRELDMASPGEMKFAITWVKPIK